VSFSGVPSKGMRKFVAVPGLAGLHSGVALQPQLGARRRATCLGIPFILPANSASRCGHADVKPS
jgi:hypothetical protein